MVVAHEVMSYIKFYNLVNIRKMKKVIGLANLKKVDNVICKQCQIGKMTKPSFKSKTFTYDDILELVHIGLCGPIGVQSHCGDKYFILLVDAYSRMMTLMFLKEKFDSF